tara:strand:+ start:24476 stop:25372 length:897 start_codon:yes stop_codon:yes gene_type:complete
LKEFKDFKKFAAIDIGSNAIRLLISNVYVQNDDSVDFTKNSLVRVPVRLGQDAFTKGLITKKNISKLIDTISAFKLLMKIHKVDKYLAYATSAIRNCSNAQEIVKKVFNDTGVEIKIISGIKEAKLITENKIFKNKTDTFCFIDVGGGSTELTILMKSKIIKSKSFKIGGVRLINNLVSKKTWSDFDNWIKNNLTNKKNIRLIGFGGNINKIYKIAGTRIGKPLSTKKLNSIIRKLEKMSDKEKLLNYRLNPDKLDIIVPASKVYKFLIDKLNLSQIEVPKIGLSDGMISELINKSKT